MLLCLNRILSAQLWFHDLRRQGVIIPSLSHLSPQYYCALLFLGDQQLCPCLCSLLQQFDAQGVCKSLVSSDKLAFVFLSRRPPSQAGVVIIGFVLLKLP